MRKNEKELVNNYS